MRRALLAEKTLALYLRTSRTAVYFLHRNHRCRLFGFLSRKRNLWDHDHF